MKQAIKTIFILLAGQMLLNSCKLFHSVRKTTVIKTENTSQQLPQGTFESTTVTTTQTVTESNPQIQMPTAAYNCSGDEITPPVFKPISDTIIKGEDTITINSKTTVEKKPTTFTQKDEVAETVDHSNPEEDCYTKTISINANSSSFMSADYEAQGQYIYPGAIYDYADFKSGNYKDFTVSNSSRNPIKLQTDNPNITGSTWLIINNPDLSSIRDGIAGIYNRFDNRQVGTMNLRYQTYECNSEAEYSMRLSAGASYAKFSIETEMKNTTKTADHYITIDAIKPLYTISCQLPCSKNYYKSAVPNEKNPVVISSVTYGIRVLANFKLRTNTKDELLKFKAKYDGIGTSAHVDFDYLTKEANIDQTINCYVVGGPGFSSVAFNKEDLEKNLKNIVGGITYATARPISYELRDLAGNIIETESATDKINIRKCVPHVDEPILQTVVVKIRTGNNDKDHDTHYAIYLRKGIDANMTPNANDCSLINNADVHYNNNSFKVENMNVPIQIKREDFAKSNGGTVSFRFTNGNDTWNISNLSIVLIFKGETPVTIDYNGFDVSDEDRVHNFLFDKDFHAIQ